MSHDARLGGEAHTAARSDAVVTIRTIQFAPDTLRVAAGTRVVWTGSGKREAGNGNLGMLAALGAASRGFALPVSRFPLPYLFVTTSIAPPGWPEPHFVCASDAL